MAEFLERLLSEVRERPAASREAVREYEQLQQALAALDGVEGNAALDYAATAGNSRVAPRSSRVRRSAATGSRTANRERLLALVTDRPGVTREELEASSGLSSAAVAQNLRRMGSRGEIRQQRLPGGQVGYAAPHGETEAAAAPNNPATSASGTDGSG